MIETPLDKFSIDRESHEKLYVQLEEIIKKKIESKEYAIDAQIPTEEDLCKKYGISKATVRLAVLELVRQGYLMRQQGKGTFVCKRVIPEGLMMSMSFKELMLDAGVNFTTDVLVRTVMMPTDDLQLKLTVPDDKHIIYIKRLRRIEGEPVLFQEAYVPHYIAPSLLNEDIENSSVVELLEKNHNIKITKVQDYIGIEYLNEGEGKTLGLQEGSPALLLEQYFYSGNTQVMYMRSVKMPERFRFFFEFERKHS